MWFEILPSFSIIVACLTVPSIVTYATNRLFLGNAYRRTTGTYDQAYHYLRDFRVSGNRNPYNQKTLDICPLEDIDEVGEGEEEKKKCE